MDMFSKSYLKMKYKILMTSITLGTIFQTKNIYFKVYVLPNS